MSVFGENIQEALEVIQDWVKEVRETQPETQLDHIERRLEKLEKKFLCYPHTCLLLQVIALVGLEIPEILSRD